ncbi:MAG: transcription factor FapR [Firmicutes bacterium]|jgi:acyl-coenzyme A thioesterase PaaI-like protein|nr:transcription factor FapR [Bacillota bacterium]
MAVKLKKKDRHKVLEELLSEEPFVTDEELSEKFGVSIQTIRLDRLELGIPELRERIKSAATNNYSKVKSILQSEIVGELIDIELNKSGISILETDKTMVFNKSRVVKGHYIFAMAESLAYAIIDEEVAITGVANIKYRVPVLVGQKLVAKANIKSIRENEYIVHVMINVKDDQVFRGKFMLRSVIA